jgi:hypothetical protein
MIKGGATAANRGRTHDHVRDHDWSHLRAVYLIAGDRNEAPTPKVPGWQHHSSNEIVMVALSTKPREGKTNELVTKLLSLLPDSLLGSGFLGIRR